MNEWWSKSQLALEPSIQNDSDTPGQNQRNAHKYVKRWNSIDATTVTQKSEGVPQFYSTSIFKEDIQPGQYIGIDHEVQRPRSTSTNPYVIDLKCSASHVYSSSSNPREYPWSSASLPLERHSNRSFPVGAYQTNGQDSRDNQTTHTKTTDRSRDRKDKSSKKHKHRHRNHSNQARSLDENIDDVEGVVYHEPFYFPSSIPRPRIYGSNKRF